MLLRGRFMAAVARMERTGIPIHAPLPRVSVANWEEIKGYLIVEVDQAYGVYEGASFRQARFAQYVRVVQCTMVSMISAPTDQIDDDVAAMREIMSKAGRVVTCGIDVRTDVKTARWPGRYMDPRGESMWNRVMTLLGRPTTDNGTGARERDTTSVVCGTRVCH